jgi:uncharacterized protein YoxC
MILTLVAALIAGILCVLVFYLFTALEEVQGEMAEQQKFTQYLHNRIQKLEHPE